MSASKDDQIEEGLAESFQLLVEPRKNTAEKSKFFSAIELRPRALSGSARHRGRFAGSICGSHGWTWETATDRGSWGGLRGV